MGCHIIFLANRSKNMLFRGSVSEVDEFPRQSGGISTELTWQFEIRLEIALVSDVNRRISWPHGDYLLINILLTTFGARPLLKAEKPSSRHTRYKPCRAFPYTKRSAGAFAPSAHIRTSTTSVGLPIRPAIPPATPAQAMLQDVETFSWPVHFAAAEER